MGNINAPSIDFYESYAAEIQSKFQRVKTLVPHRVASGDYHEEILRVVLRNFLTKRFSVKTGFIYKSPSEVSNQIDIMVVDESSPAAYLFQEGDFAVVIPEAVVAIIEVKTTLNAKDFDSALENIASAKRLPKFPASLAGILFGYAGTSPSDKVLDKWFKRPIPSKLGGSVEENILGPDAMMFLKSGTLLARFNENGDWAIGGKYYHKIFRDDVIKKSKSDVAWQISIILAMLVSSCEHKESTKTHTFTESFADRLVQFEGSQRSHSRFAFAEGYSSILS